MSSKAAGTRKWKRQQKAKADKAQAVFTPDAQGIRTRPHTVIKHDTIDLTRIVFCPFCLKSNQLRTFLMSTKKGISQNSAQCPSCNRTMRMTTVTRKWTPETFADWVYGYRKSGFWQKINFKEWVKELEIKGWSVRFFDRYHKLKGEDTQETYSEYMDRMGREAAAEWNDSPSDYY